MLKRSKFAIISVCLCLFWLVSCAPKATDEVEIVIISINDTHGSFEYLAEFAALVEETEDLHDNVIVVDAGDRFTGNPYNDFYEKREFPIIDLENSIGVDVAAIGNHEFDYGQDLFKERMDASDFVEISANIETSGTNLTDIKPYYIVEKEGVKIAFLGLTNVEELSGKPATLYEQVAHIRFYDPIETAVKYRYLTQEANVLVALTHIGINEDLVLADSMPELHLIIGGHSHTLIDTPLIRNDVLITQAERGTKYAGKTTILLKKGFVSQITTEMINLAQYGEKDATTEKKVQKYNSNAFLKKPLVTLQYEIPTLEQLGYAIADAGLMLPNVDFSVVQCGGIRVNSLPAGPVTYADVLRIYPFNNYLVITDLKPAEIRKLIEMEFLEKKNCMMLPAGFEYEARKTPDGAIKVGKMTDMNGKKLRESQTYRVALNNYLFSNYLLGHLDKAEITHISMVDNILDYLKHNPNVDYRNAPVRAKYN